MSHCCPSNGAAWDTPVPSPTTIVPPGTQVLATPAAYSGCGCSSGAASAVTGGATAGAPGALVSIYPVMKQAAEVPAVGGIFQIYSTGASQWAVAGMQIWFPPFGYGEITGVTGDLIAVKNLDITLGTVLGSDSPLLAFPPPAPVAAITLPTLKQFKKSRPRPVLYSQVRSGGAAWTAETVSRDLATYAGFDATYKAALLSVNLAGYSGTRSFDLFVKIDGIEYTRVRMAAAGSADTSNGLAIIPIDAGSVISIEAGEFTNAGGTYGPCDVQVFLDGFIP